MPKRKCRHCKEYGEKDEGITVPLGWFCSFDCVTDHGKERLRRSARKRSGKKTKSIDKGKERTETMADLINSKKLKKYLIGLSAFAIVAIPVLAVGGITLDSIMRDIIELWALTLSLDSTKEIAINNVQHAITIFLGIWLITELISLLRLAVRKLIP